MKPTIVIITDDVLFVKLVESLLTRKIADLQIVLCASHQDLNEKFHDESCRLIIVDGGMSGLSSIEMLQYIRLKKHIVTPIWFFPEIQTVAYIQKSIEMGASRIIKKPFDPHKVTAEITFLLFKKSMERIT